MRNNQSIGKHKGIKTIIIKGGKKPKSRRPSRFSNWDRKNEKQKDGEENFEYFVDDD